MAFYHMAVADRGLLDTLAERCLTAIGCEIIQQEDGRLPVLAAISEIAGQMTMPIAAHLLRSSSGGRGILLGGTPGVPPARVVVLGAGAVGFAAARGAAGHGRARHGVRQRPRQTAPHHGARPAASKPAWRISDAIAEARGRRRRGDRRHPGGRHARRRTW